MMMLLSFNQLLYDLSTFALSYHRNIQVYHYVFVIVIDYIPFFCTVLIILIGIIIGLIFDTLTFFHIFLLF